MKRDLVQWWLRPGFTRRRGARKKILFAGPWVGEFGWELMNWQGWVRALAPLYEEVVICARESSRALYADMRHRFEPHTIRGAADHVILHGVQNQEERMRVEGLVTEEMDHLRPRVFVPAAAQQFIRFGEVQNEVGVDVLIHARGRGENTERNWPVEKWVELIAALRDRGLCTGAIGLRGATLDVPGVVDLRDQPLQATMNTLASVKALLGPSSGPMHLASLCGTPHVVWTNQGIYRMGKTSRQKYESWWNPLRTPVVLLDDEGFGMEVDPVLNGLQQLLGQ